MTAAAIPSRLALCSAALLAGVVATAPARAAETEARAELIQAVNMRCIYEMGEFGNDAVHACMRLDLDAADALAQYPPEAQASIERCSGAMWMRGYAVVRVCVDRELRAAAAIVRYRETHAAIVRACEEGAGEKGPIKLQACIEAALAESASLPR